LRISRKFPPYPQALAMRQKFAMSLEDAIQVLTAAVNANTAAVKDKHMFDFIETMLKTVRSREEMNDLISTYLDEQDEFEDHS